MFKFIENSAHASIANSPQGNPRGRRPTPTLNLPPAQRARNRRLDQHQIRRQSPAQDRALRRLPLAHLLLRRPDRTRQRDRERERRLPHGRLAALPRRDPAGHNRAVGRQGRHLAEHGLLRGPAGAAVGAVRPQRVPAGGRGRGVCVAQRERGGGERVRRVFLRPQREVLVSRGDGAVDGS